MAMTPKAAAMVPDQKGILHLRWIWRFQLMLLPVGALAWMFKSFISSAVFLAGGILSISYWLLHVWIVGRMLTPSKKLRWFYAVIGLSKLALIAILLHVIVKHFPAGTLPFVVGLTVFVAAILLEAARLVICHFLPTRDNENQL
jgi:hypothetical protein